MLENSMVRHDVRPWEWDKWDDDDNSNVCGYDDDEDEEEDW